jgi:hypothetical protein
VRKQAQFCVIASITWLATIGVAEGVFRTLGDRPTFDLRGLYAPFEAQNYRLAANVDTEANWSSGRLTVHTDELGLRCDQARRFATRRKDLVDVLLLGDSQGFGNGVSFEDSLAGACATSAAKDGYRVANASVGGHSAASQLQLAKWLHEREGVIARHYVVLATPAISQSGDFVSRAKVGDDGRLYDGVPNFTSRVRLWIKTHLVLYARIRDALRNSGISDEPAKEAPFVFKFYEGGTTEQSMKRSFSGYISRLKGFAEQNGAKVHIIYVPLTLEMEFEPIQAAATSRGLNIDRDVPLRVCASVAAESGVAFHNLRPVLEVLQKRNKPLHLTGDFHYDRELSVDCGNAIWTALKSSILLSNPPNSSKEKSSHGE